MSRGDWPKSKSFARRYNVADLIPTRLKVSELKAVFIGESPHRDEVASESPEERSPFRGAAGREWWAELAKFMDTPVQTRPVPSRTVLLAMCSELEIAIMNAVQYPLDPKITLHQGLESAPRVQLGFEKGSGKAGYKAFYRKEAKDNPVILAVEDLARRMAQLGDAHAQMVSLGNDSRWFVERAIELLKNRRQSELPLLQKPLVTIPHPSSWWRNGSYRARAVRVIDEILRS